MEIGMNRRDALKTVAAAAVAEAAVFSPAVAQSAPDVKWRLVSSYPKSLDTAYGAAETFAKYVAATTDNKFQIQVFAAGEIVPGLQVLEAVAANTVEMCHGVLMTNWGKDPTWALATGGPFTLNSRMMSAWMYYGGGIDLLNEFFAKNNVFGLPCGNTGTQMGGWYRKEIKTVADLNGLKMRVAGLAGSVLSKLGVVPQQLAGGDIYPALERGTIDAAEWVGPYDDEKLGFAKIAPYYYFPGFWEGQACQHLNINLARWNELPTVYQAAIKVAAQATNSDMQAKYDALNAPALKRLVANGAQLRAFSQEILDAAFAASQEVYNGMSAANPGFKKIYESMTSFRSDAYLWFSIAEYSYDSFMMRQQRSKKI
jgi:TRAP-type mannitol/chloroaromatic compound transport system substrate-binding protein